MRISHLLLLTLLIFNLFIDWYVYRQVVCRCHRRHLWGRLELWSAIAMSLTLVIGIIIPTRQGCNQMLMTKIWLLFSYISIYFPKIIGIIFDLAASAPRLFGRKRLKILTVAGITLSIISFCAIWWGTLINRFKIETKEVEIEIADLPDSFNGFRIVQFSDLHVGTYGADTTYISRLVNHINDLNPDLIVFTGDIVTRESNEITPFISTLRRLQSHKGVIAILGNHDYGDYMAWESDSAKRRNMDTLYNAYRAANIKLLRNQTENIVIGQDTIYIIGVENIGDPPFPIYGSLTTAYPTPGDDKTKILLSHNPAHWTDSIAGNNNVNIPLTLAGHTHAMQIEIAGLSPSAWRYTTWGGLYTDTNKRHRLYVNIGIGTVAMPMRLGATPEVTLLTLHKPQ